MNWYQIFYWLTVANNARGFFWFFAVVFSIIAIIATLVYFFNLDDSSDDKDNRKQCKHWMFWSYPFMILFWFGIVFTPSRKDALLIVAGGGAMEFLQNDSTAKQIPRELLNFVSAELKSMAAEAKVDMKVEDQKADILDEAKKMTTTELLNKMKVDTTFAKVILEK
jgi:hypothetical protein